MPTRLKILAIAAALAAGTSSVAMAQCAPGYAPYGGVCQPVGPVSGAAAGGASGAASGNAAAGPVGAIVGGAIGTATGAVAGTANALSAPFTPPPGCAPGYVNYNGYCYPAH
ncbi:MAG TPA: hypothetical protein VGF34_03960 [Stellaceae bacterium]|jgi:hypothetical protein